MTSCIVQVASRKELSKAIYLSISTTRGLSKDGSGNGKTSLTCLRTRTSKTSFISKMAGHLCRTSITQINRTLILRPDTILPTATLTTTRGISLRDRGTTLGITGKLLAQTHTFSNGMLRIMRTGRHPLRTLSGSTPNLAHKDLTLVQPTRFPLTQLQPQPTHWILGLKLSMAALVPRTGEPITKTLFHPHQAFATMLGIPTLQSLAALNGVTKTFTGICWRTRLIFTKTVMLTASPRDLSSPLWAFSWVLCTPSLDWMPSLCSLAPGDTDGESAQSTARSSPAWSSSLSSLPLEPWCSLSTTLCVPALFTRRTTSTCTRWTMTSTSLSPPGSCPGFGCSSLFAAACAQLTDLRNESDASPCLASTEVSNHSTWQQQI